MELQKLYVWKNQALGGVAAISIFHLPLFFLFNVGMLVFTAVSISDLDGVSFWRALLFGTIASVAGIAIPAITKEFKENDDKTASGKKLTIAEYGQLGILWALVIGIQGFFLGNLSVLAYNNSAPWGDIVWSGFTIVIGVGLDILVGGGYRKLLEDPNFNFSNSNSNELERERKKVIDLERTIKTLEDEIVELKK